MAILTGILKDSRAHYEKLERKIRHRLKQLPKGSVYKRKIGKRAYYYLSVRSGERVRSKYLGKEIPADLEKAIEERRLLIKQRQDIRKSLKILSRTLRKPHG